MNNDCLPIYFEFIINPTEKQLSQIINLYQTAGWWIDGSDNLELIKKIISGSHCFLIAIKDYKIIGMGRSISDKISDAYIQDVVVDIDYRNKGIGTDIIQHISERLIKDGLKWLGLIAEKGSHGFYERLGFKQMKDSVPMLKVLL